MITAESILTRIIDAVPPGVALDGWFRRRGGEGVRRAVQRALDRRMQQDTGGRMQPDPEIVPDQFAPREVVAFDPATIALEATGPSPERRAALLAERDALTPKTWSRSAREAYIAKDRIKAINKELAGNEAQKEVLRWIKARAAKSPGGAFDPDTVAAAFRFMPGWSIKETTGLIHINNTTNEALLAVLHGKRASGLTAEDYHRAGWWHAAWPEGEPLPPIRVVEGSTIRAKRDQPIVPVPEVGAVYSSRGADRGHWGGTPTMLLYKPAVGVRGWMITAPMGGDYPVFDKPALRSDEPLTAPGFHKWGYTFGLGEAAQAALGAAEAAVPKAASTGDEWARNLCQVCFRAHSITPKGNTLVDHGHRRPGWGYNVDPCEGAKHSPYSVACDYTALYLWGLRARLTQRRAELTALHAGQQGGTPLVFTVKVYVEEEYRDYTHKTRTRRVVETNAYLISLYGPWKVANEDVHSDDPRWEEIRQQNIAKKKAAIVGLRGAIPFYAAAVRLHGPWAKEATVATVYHTLQNGITAVDKEGL